MSTTQTITADNVTALFPSVSTRFIGADLPPNHTPTHSLPQTPNGIDTTDGEARPSSTSDSDPLSGYDAEQIRLMDEVCIVLDYNDAAIGTASKKDCHLMTNINQGLLHRAFSVFLFHPTTHKLLLQQRATEKITFPDMWTNTCCSHPLAHPSETGLGDISSNVEGAKRAAIRKLDHELGIPTKNVPIERFEYLTRIHYMAPSDGKWGEHEIDYILFIEADPEVTVNENEVRDTRWVSREELQQMFKDVERGNGKDKDLKYTPWFKLICETMLYTWWEAMEKGQLGEHTGDGEIRRM